jgi:hypothetical protein
MWREVMMLLREYGTQVLEVTDFPEKGTIEKIHCNDHYGKADSKPKFLKSLMKLFGLPADLIQTIFSGVSSALALTGQWILFLAGTSITTFVIYKSWKAVLDREPTQGERQIALLASAVAGGVIFRTFMAWNGM